MLDTLPTPKFVARGQVVAASGLYRMPINWYHDQCCAEFSISSTGLRRLLLESPAHYFAYSPLNPDPFPEPDTASFALGRAAHALCLEGRLSRKEFAVHPFADFMTNEGMEAPDGHKSYAAYKKAWKAKAERLGLTLVSGSDLIQIGHMYRALHRHHFMKIGALSGLVEPTLIYRHPAGFYIKARPDVLPLDSALWDYKTVRSAKKWKFEYSVKDYGYDMQLALVEYVAGKVLGLRIENSGFLIQEKTPPYIVSFHELKDADRVVALQMVEDAIGLLERCIESGDWPGYPDDGAPLVLDRKYGGKPDIGSLDDVLSN